MERKRRTTGSNRPKARDASDLVERRRKLLETYFENGRQIAGELVQEIEAARVRLAALESDNARLRMQLKSNEAIRELIGKIEALEAEREALTSRSEEVARQARDELARAAAVEGELSNLAGLYVASSQLHASLDLREVLQTMGQLLLQFIGAGAYAIYSVEGDKLVPVASEGLALERLKPERVGEGAVGSSFLASDVVRVATDGRRPRSGSPIVTVPLRLGDQAIGAVAVFELLEQKPELLDADFDLLRMLATQGATALAGARLYSAAGGAVPRLAVNSADGSAR